MGTWGMYAPDGDRAVTDAVLSTDPNMSVESKIDSVQRAVSKEHPEVHDTVVREALFGYFSRHVFDSDYDRCRCGSGVVYFEDGDADGYHGEGCEANGRVWDSVRERINQAREEADSVGGLDAWIIHIM